MSPLSHGELRQMEEAAKNRAQRHTCKNCRYSFPLSNRTEYRCIKMNKVYTLDTIKLRLCSNWKEPRKAGEKDAEIH